MREKVKLKDNSKGGIMHVVADDRFDEGFHIAVEVEQREVRYDMEQRTICTDIRSCAVRGELSIVMMIDREPGQVMGFGTGKIVIKESIEPPYPDDVEAGLKWHKGSVCRDKDGNPIYQRVFYTEDPGQQDVFIS